MKKQFLILTGSLALLAVTPTPVMAGSCAQVQNQNSQFPREAQWRQAFTWTKGPSGQVVATNAAREALMQARSKEMNDELFATKDTPHMSFFVEAAPNLKQTEIVPSVYLSGKTPTIKIQGVQGSVLKGTLMLPVSGHDGIQKATAWSKADRFDLTMTTGPLAAHSSGSGQKHLLTQVLSMDMVTVVELEIPLTQKADGSYEPVNLLYYRLGVKNHLGSPGGYWEGRALTIQLEP